MKNTFRFALAVSALLISAHASAQSVYDCTLKINGLRSATSAGTQPGYNLTSNAFRVNERLGTLTQVSAIAFTYTGSSTDAKDQQALYSMTHSAITVNGTAGKTGAWLMDGVKLGNLPWTGTGGAYTITGVPSWSNSSSTFRSTSNSVNCTRRIP